LNLDIPRTHVRISCQTFNDLIFDSPHRAAAARSSPLQSVLKFLPRATFTASISSPPARQRELTNPGRTT
jgi:hypothetical protein